MAYQGNPLNLQHLNISTHTGNPFLQANLNRNEAHLIRNLYQLNLIAVIKCNKYDRVITSNN